MIFFTNRYTLGKIVISGMTWWWEYNEMSEMWERNILILNSDAMETILKDIADAENNNLRMLVRKYTKEVAFFNELKNLFSRRGGELSEDYAVIINLFMICENNMVFLFTNFLRGHFIAPNMITRKSIEATIHATIVNEDVTKNSKIWMRGEKEGQDKKDFEKVFKKDKYRNCKNPENLKRYFKRFSSMSHSNIISGMHKHKKEEGKVLFEYFDYNAEESHEWMMRYLNDTIQVYLYILEEFVEIFGNKINLPLSDIILLRSKHSTYLRDSYDFKLVK